MPPGAILTQLSNTFGGEPDFLNQWDANFFEGLKVDTQTGNDSVQLLGIDVWGKTEITTGDGQDFVGSQGSSFDEFLTQLGAGDDLFSLCPAVTFFEAFLLDGGQGYDTFEDGDDGFGAGIDYQGPKVVINVERRNDCD